MIERVAQAFTRTAERWLPDAFVFALLATIAVFGAGLSIGVPARALVVAWGDGFPDLLAFAMQMSLVIVTGYVGGVSPPAARVKAWATRSIMSARAPDRRRLPPR